MLFLITSTGRRLYGTAEGQWVVSRQCQAQRVIVVKLEWQEDKRDLSEMQVSHPSYDAAFGRIECFLQEALSPSLLHLIPKAIRFTPKATPFLTSNEEVDVFCDRAIYDSDISGKIVVRDCIKEGSIVRCLHFGQNASLIQSEVPLQFKTSDMVPDLSETPSCTSRLPSILCAVTVPDVEALQIDTGSLSAKYHQVIVSGLCALLPAMREGKELMTILVGLGGGLLPMYLMAHCHLKLLPVELDPIVVEIAREWFGMATSVEVQVGDGIEYIHRQSKEVCFLSWPHSCSCRHFRRARWRS